MKLNNYENMKVIKPCSINHVSMKKTFVILIVPTIVANEHMLVLYELIQLLYLSSSAHN